MAQRNVRRIPTQYYFHAASSLNLCLKCFTALGNRLLNYNKWGSIKFPRATNNVRFNCCKQRYYSSKLCCDYRTAWIGNNISINSSHIITYNFTYKENRVTKSCVCVSPFDVIWQTLTRVQVMLSNRLKFEIADHMHTSLQLKYLRIMIDVNCFKTWLVLLIETERFNNLTRTYVYNGPRYMIS